MGLQKLIYEFEEKKNELVGERILTHVPQSFTVLKP